MSKNRFSRSFYYLTIFGLVLLAIMVKPGTPPLQANGTIVGTVCIATQGTSTSGCPSSTAIIVGSTTVGSHVIVAVNVDGSDALNGFRVFVKTDNTILNPLSADLGNSLLSGLGTVLTLANCVNGAGTGCTLSGGDGPGVVDVGAVELGPLSTPPTTGGLFEITYDVVSSTPQTGLPITIISQGITNGGTTTNPETVQNGIFVNSPTFIVSSSQTFRTVPVGSQNTSTINIDSFVGFTGAVALAASFNVTSSNNPTATLVPTTVTLTNTKTSLTSILTVSASTSNQAGGYNITVTGSGGTPLQTRSVSIIVRVVAQPLLTTSVPSTVVVGNSITDSATLSQHSTNAGGSVTYNLFLTAGCTGIPQSTHKVTVSLGIVPDSPSLLMTNAGTFSFNATYTGDTYDNSTLSSCEPFTVAKASPTLTTLLSSTLVNINSGVSDQASLTAGFFGPSSGPPYSSTIGHVTYTLSPGKDCVGTPVDISVVAVSGNTGQVPASRVVTFNATDIGFWSWNATYTGDDNNNAAANHTCENLQVAIISDFTITSSTSAVTMKVGTTAPVTITITSVQGFADKVSLTNSSNPAPGLGLTCSPNPVTVTTTQPGTSICTISALSSGVFTLTISGNNTALTLTHSITPSITVTVTKASPTISTQIFDSTNNPVPLTGGIAVVVNGTSIYDKPILTNGFHVTGTITFTYYTSIDCTGNAAITKDLSISSSGTLPTFGEPNLPSTLKDTPGSYGFQAKYLGDGNNTASNPLLSPCESLVVNMLPVSHFIISSSAPYLVQQNVIFDASASFDPDAVSTSDHIVNYYWDFGDGSTGTGVAPSHSYTDTKSYTISLKVGDLYSNSSAFTMTIKVDTLTVQLTTQASATSTSVGKILTVSVDVKNTGTLDLNFTVLLQVNNQMVDQKNLVLVSGQDSGSFQLSWNTTQYAAGTYTVTVRIANAKTTGTTPTSVTVPTSPQTTTVDLSAVSPTFPLPGGPIPWAILGIVVVAGAVGLILWRRRRTTTV